MGNTSSIIQQIILKHNLHHIYRGRDESSFNDLVHVAYMQIERTLYKYKSAPHCRNCFTYERPHVSCLYIPGQYDYHIMKPDEVVDFMPRCPNCGIKLHAYPILEPKQGLYGGTWTIMYRGTSKVFNLWCVAPDSMIITNNGIEEIGDTFGPSTGVIDGVEYGECDYKVFTERGLQDAVKWARRFSVPTIKVTTKFGYNVTASLDHQFFVLGEGGVHKIRAEDLQEGMLLGIQYNQQQFGDHDSIDFKTTVKTNKLSWKVPEKWTEDLAYLVGMIVSEGFVTPQDKSVSICNSEIGDFLESNPCGLKFTRRDDTIVYQNCSKVFGEFVQWLGIKSGASTKVIPKQILKCSKPIVVAFLRGLFDGDGHSKRNNGSVGYTSTSLKLIDQLRVVLLNFGILTKNTTSTRETRQFSTISEISQLQTAYQLTLPTHDSRLFYDQIGFNIARKQQKRDKLPPTNFKLLDQITSNRIQEVTRSISFGDFKRISGNCDWRQNIGKKDRLTIETFDKLFNMFEEYRQNDFLASRHKDYVSDQHKMLWLPIESLGFAGLMDTVDIEVPATGSFVGGGITFKNSQVARTVILAHVKKDSRDKRNNPSYKNHFESQRSRISSQIFVEMMKHAENMLWYDPVALSVLYAFRDMSFELTNLSSVVVKKNIAQATGLNKKDIEKYMVLLQLVFKDYKNAIKDVERDLFAPDRCSDPSSE